jgi:hypothetical protein
MLSYVRVSNLLSGLREEMVRVLGWVVERPVMMDMEWIKNFRLNLPDWFVCVSVWVIRDGYLSIYWT